MSCHLRRAAAQDGPVMGAVLQGWIEATLWMPILHSLQDTPRFYGSLVARAECWVAEETHVLGVLAKKNRWITALYLEPGGGAVIAW